MANVSLDRRSLILGSFVDGGRFERVYRDLVGNRGVAGDISYEGASFFGPLSWRVVEGGKA